MDRAEIDSWKKWSTGIPLKDLSPEELERELREYPYITKILAKDPDYMELSAEDLEDMYSDFRGSLNAF